MSGYKQTLQNMEPKLLLTFDGDTFDPLHRTLISDTQVFMDESGYANDCLLHSQNDSYPAYRMGIPSLVENELTAQNAISLGWYGPQPTAPDGVWQKAFIEVSHKSWFEFLGNNGSFTFGWMMNRHSNEDAFRNYYGYPVAPYSWNGLVRPVFRKGSLFNCYYEDNWSLEDRYYIVHPNGTFILNMNTYSWIYGRDCQWVFTWDVVEVESGKFEATATLYINGHIIMTDMKVYYDTPPNTYVADPFEIGGTFLGGGTLAQSDRNTSRVDLDQIFVFDRALSQDEILRTYKKIHPYDKMILMERCTQYWPLNDAGSATDFTMKNLVVGGVDGVYLGGNSKAVRAQSPPDAIGQGSSTFFQAGGCALARKVTPQSVVVPVDALNGDWTVHFWASIVNAERGVLFSLQTDDYPNKGILCLANVRNGVDQSGAIEFSISDDYRVNSLANMDDGTPWLFNDGQDHVYTMVHRSGSMELWIDGRMHSDKLAPYQPIVMPGNVYLMGMTPGHISVTGRMSNVAFTPYALDPAEIRMRAAFRRLWRVKGQVTLQGNPHQATIRIMDHRNGQLILETLSDSLDGLYSADLFDNRLVDLMAINKQDPNIKCRAFGPITPMGYEDVP